MLRSIVTKGFCPKTSAIIRNGSSSAGAPEKWNLLAGVLVERLPIISKAYTPMEQKFTDTLRAIEFEKSMKSDHELRHERDLKQAEYLKRGDVDVDLDAASKQTAQDYEDANIEELKKFQPAPRTTAADKSNNLQSVERKLDQTLTLLVEQNIGSSTFFILPQGERKDGENMRQTAERVLKEKCGDKISVQFYGNAPCGFYKYKYPKEHRKDTVGAKVFFYRASFVSGQVDENVAKKFEWLDKQSAQKRLPEKYNETVTPLII